MINFIQRKKNNDDKKQNIIREYNYLCYLEKYMP